MYKRLFIWIEGRDDKEFFDKVMKSEFERKYGRGRVHIRQYSEMRNEEVAGVLEGIKAKNDDYICVADINNAPCVSERKREKQEEEFKDVDEDRIMIVRRKIESWYLAGLDDDACKRFGFPPFDSTDEFGKGRFKELQQRAKFNSRVNFLREILKCYDIETARRKNKSFKCFVEKYDP